MIRNKKIIETLIKSVSPLLFGFLFTLLLSIPIVLIVGQPSNISEILFLSSFEIFGWGLGAIIFMYIIKNRNGYDYFNVIYWDKLDTIKIKPFLLWIFIGLIALFSANILITLISSVIDVEMAENVLFDFVDDNPVYILYFIPVMLLLVGPIEEFLFRGILQGVIRDFYDVNTGLIVASLGFGLIHIPAAGGLSKEAFIYVITTFLLGLILGYIYEKRKSILIPSIIHGVYNSILLIGYYYVQIM